ncbi:flagellar hook-associated protein FlgK [Alloiococcus sp. CFN-8]|uniref:flagellar hook-associated protein FlgK n=1 Tax=Alloiococcus sp. CFN-8 TaxID=3416081 RepID=UPI003CFAD4C1
MAGLFSTFNISRSGLNAQQTALDVTSHNISNANSVGYSRQRARMEASKPQTINNLSFQGDQLGTGVQVATIERIRDSFTDYQIRNESSTLSAYASKSNFLTQVEGIFNEPSDTGISTLMGEFFDSWQKLSKDASSSNARTIVAQQTKTLTDTLNDTAKKLKELEDNARTLIKSDVININSVLNQINDLNKQIRSVEVMGSNANDLMDKRDNLLDSLSSLMNINVEKNSLGGVTVTPGDKTNMLESDLVTTTEKDTNFRFSYISSIVKDSEAPNDFTYTISYYKLGDMLSENNKNTIKVSGISEKEFEQLNEGRVLWASVDGTAVKADGTKIANNGSIEFSELQLFAPSSGELNGNITIQKDIQDYRTQLDKLAQTLAYAVNGIHSGKVDGEKDALPFFVNGSLTNSARPWEGENTITAENITINKEILEDVMKIKTKTNDHLFDHTKDNNIDGETDGSRALAIATLANTLIRVQGVSETIKNRKDFFDPSKGAELKDNGMVIESNINGMTLNSYYQDTIDRLGIQSQQAQRIVNNENALLDSLTALRNSISGVSLDEEMANLVQYQHAYQANAKVLATITELLDVIINGLI